MMAFNKFRERLAMAYALVVVVLTVLWFSSPLFRAWIRHPVVMYECEFKLDWPSELCLGVATIRDLQRMKTPRR